MKNIQSKTIAFITGAFVHNSCRDEWKSYFESKYLFPKTAKIIAQTETALDITITSIKF